MSVKLKDSFLFHLGIVLAICVLLYIAFFTSLHCFTKHGQELTIPDVRGKNITAAIDQLQAMRFEVSIDSTYEPDQKPLTVLKQVPDTASVVKEGRTVFLTVNMLNPPYIPMPNLVSLSYRSAVTLLKNNKLAVGDTSSRPDIAGGAILEQRYRGAPIRPGEMIAQGSKISLVIGNGLGNQDFNVPDLVNRTVEEAIIVLSPYNLTPIIVPADGLARITDTASAVVVDQEPSQFNDAGAINKIKAGDIITLRIQQNAEGLPDNRKAPSDVNNEKKQQK
jgi:beta-lactam-binding protein with PASTA domain